MVGCSVSVGVTILVRAGMAGGGRGSCALCLFECVATRSHVPPAEGCDSFVNFWGT